MALIASRNMDLTVNSVALECYANNFEQALEQNMVDVTTFCDAGPRSLVDSYTWNAQLSGPNDFASGALDATIFGLVGNAGVAYAFQPTGGTADTNSPEYDGTVVLQSYSIRAAVGQAITHQTRLMGNSALTRDVTP